MQHSARIAQALRARREALGLTRDDLARLCADTGHPELSYAAITNIETGRVTPGTGVRRRAITIDELVILAAALNLPAARLLDGTTCGVCASAPPAGMTCNCCGASTA